MPEDPLRDRLHTYSKVLDARIPDINTLEDYHDGRYPAPPLIADSELTKGYRILMELCGANWPELIVSAASERLEVQGVRFGDNKETDDEVWEDWQRNGLDAESAMLHDSVLTNGRGYAIVWGDGSDDPEPIITYEHASTCVVEYEPGNSRKRRGALRRWKDGDRWYANLFTPGRLHKFVSDGEEIPQQANGWKPLGVLNGIPNEVPVVEFAVNRSLRPAPFGTGHGDYATKLRHIDRIHYKVFSGLVALTWSGFPLRYIIGDPIVYQKDDQGQDDKTKPIPPFKALASAIAQLENPNAKIGQLPEAQIANYSPEMDIKHLAAITKTPTYYLLGELVNISADGIRAGEGGLISRVRRHMRSLGESHEEVARLSVRVRNPGDERGADQGAEIIWADPESRSLAERADAGLKMIQAGMPWRVVASKVYGMSPKEIGRAESEQAQDTLALIAQQMGSNRNGEVREPALSGGERPS